MSEILPPEEIRFLINSIPDAEIDHPHVEDVVQRYATLRAENARLRGEIEILKAHDCLALDTERDEELARLRADAETMANAIHDADHAPDCAKNVWWFGVGATIEDTAARYERFKEVACNCWKSEVAAAVTRHTRANAGDAGKETK